MFEYQNCEKVLSPTLEEGKELVDLANEKKLYLGVAPDTFLGSAIQTANYVVESGMIGEVTSCYAALNRDSSLFAELSPAGTLPGGGIGFDMGIYYVTALLSILGPVKTVTGIVDTKNPERTHQVVSKMGESFKMNCENIFSGTMVFKNGIVGNLLFDSNSIMILPEKPALVINGTLGVMYMNDPNLFGGDVSVILKGSNTPFVIPQCHPFQEDYRGVGVAEMAWSMRKGRNNRASKEMSYHALEVLSGICISSENRAHYDLQSTFIKPSPLPRGYVGPHFFKEIEETTIAN